MNSEIYSKNYAPDMMCIIPAVLGMVSCLLCQTVIIPLILSGIGIILAVLSKGRHIYMCKQAKLGLYSCIFSLVLTLLLSFGSVYLFYNNQEYRNSINATYKELYGITLDEYIHEALTTYSQN